MKNLKTKLALGMAVLALGLSRHNVAAQQRMMGMGMGMDPQQMQQMLMDNLRTALVVTNDDEWKIIEERLSKVLQVRMDTMRSSMGGMRMMFGGARGGGPGGPGGGPPGGFGGMGQSSPEADALQKAIDNNAPAAQLTDALEKFREARKRKQAELAAAQKELSDVLTPRQEAVLVSMGMLE